MKKQYVYTLPIADAANAIAVIDDISNMIDEEQLARMGKCVIEAIVKCSLGMIGSIPGGTYDFCAQTLEDCTLIEAKQLVFNVSSNKKGDAR